MLPNAKILDARRNGVLLQQLQAAFRDRPAGHVRPRGRCTLLPQLRRPHERWNEVLPGWIPRVRREQVVADLEGNVLRVLAFCGLDFDPACLEFYHTARGVNTPSAEQVRRPIYRDGIDRWQHYSKWLGPLRDGLGPLADT